MESKNIFNLLCVLLYANLFILVCCNEDSQKRNLINSDKFESRKLPKVIIKGVSDDSLALKYFNWIDENLLFGGETKIIEKTQLNQNEIMIVLDSMEQSDIMEVISFGTSKSYNYRVFVTPGDSISFKIEKGKLSFTGKNAHHYNFFIAMDSLHLTDPKFYGDIITYKKDCEKILDQQMSFFNSYVQKNPNVSEGFRKKVQAEIKFRYLANLILPNNNSRSTRKTVFAVLENKTSDANMINFQNYFDTVSFSDFDKPEMINNNFFKTSLENYIRYYFVNSDAEFFSTEYFLAEKQFISDNLQGDLQELSLARLMVSYNTFAQTDNILNLKSTIKEFKRKFPNSPYNKNIERIEKELAFVNATLSSSVLNSKVINLGGDTIQLKNIIGSNKKIKVIDFWASWCGPCINEFAESYNSRQQLSEKYGLEWIYFSIDESKTKWLNKTENLRVFGIDKNQYLILNKDSSDLINYFNVKSIPRYIILDYDGYIINGNAIRPSYQNEFDKLIKNFNRDSISNLNNH